MPVGGIVKQLTGQGDQVDAAFLQDLLRLIRMDDQPGRHGSQQRLRHV